MSRHAYKHFEETQHTYAMQLTNHRVWDYAGGTPTPNQPQGKMVIKTLRKLTESPEKSQRFTELKMLCFQRIGLPCEERKFCLDTKTKYKIKAESGVTGPAAVQAAA